MQKMIEFCNIKEISWPAVSLSAAEETFLTTLQFRIRNLYIKNWRTSLKETPWFSPGNNEEK
jgi:hypothetical protein